MSVAEELRKEGKMEGIIEGRKEGKKEGKIEVAKNMLQSGMDAEQIINLTGLSKDILEQIKEK